MNIPTESRTSWLYDTAGLILVVAVAAIVFAPWLMGNSALYWGDIGLYFEPMTRFLLQNILRGVIPLWDPKILCGVPFVGNPQVWPYYPSTILLPDLGAARYLIVDDVLHIAMAGIFCYLFLRKCGPSLGPPAALLGAVVYMLGGAITSKSQFPNMLQAVAWVPAVLLLAERIVSRPGIRSSAFFGIAFGLQVLAGHAQITLMTLYLATAYALFRFYMASGRLISLPCRQRDANLSCLRIAGWGIAAGGLGAGLAASAWLPVLDLWRHAQRQVLSVHSANRFYLPYGELTNFAIPYLHGSPYSGNWSAPGNFWETACYLGVVPVLLIVSVVFLLIRTPYRSKECVFWCGVFLASTWLALGKLGGFYLIAFYLVPGVKAFHDPARFLMGTALSGAVLSAYGAQRILSGMKSVKFASLAFLVLLCLTTIDLGYFDRHLYPVKPVSQIESTIAIPALSSTKYPEPGRGANQYRLLMLDSYAPWRYFVSYKDFKLSNRDFLHDWRESYSPNLPMIDGINEANGYEPVAPVNAEDRWEEVSNKSNPNIVLLNEMSVGTVVTYRKQPINGDRSLKQISNRTAAIRSDRITVYVNTTAFPRARYRDGAGSVWRAAAFERNDPDLMSWRLPPSAVSREFVLADTFYPGWHAYIGEGQTTSRPKAVPMTASSNGFRRIEVPASASATKIIMIYRPVTVVLGLYLTTFSVGAIAAILIGTKPVRRRFLSGA